jgi:hypothetical protein
MTTEYERLGGRLPHEVEALVKMYAAPVYRTPTHVKCIHAIFGLLKEHAISWVLFNESIQEGVFQEWEECEERECFLRGKQVGAICEDDEMDITINGFVDYLVEREILSDE